jgi:amidase
MKRRVFISTAAKAGAIFPFVFASQHAGAAPHTDIVKESFPLEEITVETLQQKMSSGSYTSRFITELYLKRIDAIDKHGPELNSVIELNPDALAIASQMDAERKSGKIRSALHGIPVLIKDNIDTADRMMTTAGSLALKGNRAAQDAFLVKQLRRAGAVILGKTNLSEWANFRSTRSTSGWSSRGGQTKNPYVLDRNPCGSSSGSGTAVAANLSAIAIGTETNGSIACPASINGIVGIKPTVGLVSRNGIIPISFTQDTAGPMARTVRDAAVLLTVMAGKDPNDASTQNDHTPLNIDYTSFLDKNALKGKRIGIEKSFLKVHEGIDGLLQKAIDQMRAQGATIVEVELMDKIKIEGAEFTLLQFEFKDGLNKYLTKANSSIKSLDQLIAFNSQHEAEIMPFFKQEILEKSQERGGLDTQEYQDALSKIIGIRGIIDSVVKENNLDAICGPATGAPWCTDLINGDHFSGYGMYSPAAMAGYPHITVPMGSIEALPVGLSFLSIAWREPELIAIAYAYEQTSMNRKAPTFITTIPANKQVRKN